jgi:hypothetical protein
MSCETGIAAALGAVVGAPLAIGAPQSRPALSLPRYVATVRYLDKVRATDSAAQIDDGQGFPTFAELLVASRLRAAGWQAIWASAYHRRFVETWAWDALEPTLSKPLPAFVLDTLEKVAAKRNALVGHSKSIFDGTPDVVAWQSSDRLLCLECKRRGKDRIQATQIEWMQAAVMIGLSMSQLGVFEWHYESGKIS